MTDRTLIGRRNDGSYGLDISLPGFDVKTTDPKNMAFSSQWGRAAIIHQTGLVTEYQNKTVTFPTLPYIPSVYLVMRFTIGSETWSSVQFLHLNSARTRFMFHPFCRVTPSSLIFDASQNGGLPSLENYTVRYCVFRIPGY